MMHIHVSAFSPITIPQRIARARSNRRKKAMIFWGGVSAAAKVEIAEFFLLLDKGDTKVLKNA